MRARFLPLILISAALIASCGGGEPFPSALDENAPLQVRLLSAVDATAEAGTARFTMKMKLHGGPGVPTESVSASGEFDMEHDRAKMTFKAAGVDFEMLVADGYVFAEQNGEWQKVRLDARQQTTPDPSAALSYLRAVADDVRVDGHETSQGDETTRYKGTLDFQHAIDSGAFETSETEEMTQVVDALGNIRMPMTVLVDAEDRLRRIDLRYDMTKMAEQIGAAPGSTVVMDLTMELYDFGIEVDIDVPEDARDISQVAGDRAIQSDLRNGLTAEKTIYTGTQAYDATIATMQGIEPSLDWGGALQVFVGGDGQMVCLQETAKSGTTFAIADVAIGKFAGTYYLREACPQSLTGESLSRLGTSW